MHLTSACGADIKKSEKKPQKSTAVIEVKRKPCERYELPIGKMKGEIKFGLANRMSS